jgi:hypothetical protein
MFERLNGGTLLHMAIKNGQRVLRSHVTFRIQQADFCDQTSHFASHAELHICEGAAVYISHQGFGVTHNPQEGPTNRTVGNRPLNQRCQETWPIGYRQDSCGFRLRSLAMRYRRTPARLPCRI